MNNLNNNRRPYLIALLCMLLSSGMLCSCKKLLSIDPPINSVTQTNVYSTDDTAIGVLTNLYVQIGDPFRNAVMPIYMGLSADELQLYVNNDDSRNRHFQNNLQAMNPGRTYDFWTDEYKMIFVCNQAIEGLNLSISLTPVVKQQLLGEAKFMRAYFHFYLANLFGDVPLVLGTDYTVNRLISRTARAKVYEQVVNDLKEAQDLLANDYPGASLQATTTERVRPTKWAATALLARVYLYMNSNELAEQEASKVIAHTALYDMTGVALDEVFKKNSRETIWSLPSVNNGVQSNTYEGQTYVLSDPPSSSWTVYLSKHVLDDFEIGDQRKSKWMGSIQQAVGGPVYYFPYKYKIGLKIADPQEYAMVLRLGEQYLIRAEARARQGKILGANSAESDLNLIRQRAGLAGTTASNQTEMLDAILRERRSELFTESCHRWFDLQRFGKIDEVMSVVCPEKGGVWAPYKALMPIAQAEINLNPSLKGHQNPGY